MPKCSKYYDDEPIGRLFATEGDLYCSFCHELIEPEFWSIGDGSCHLCGEYHMLYSKKITDQENNMTDAYKEGQEDFYLGYHDHNPYEPYSYSYKEYENGYEEAEQQVWLALTLDDLLQELKWTKAISTLQQNALMKHN